MDEFYSELYARNIPKNDGLNKVKWGYSNSGNFNSKEAIELLTKSFKLEKEVKWGKIWGGSW